VSVAAEPLTIIHDDTFTEHDLPGHPENAQRLHAIARHLESHPRLHGLSSRTATEADSEALLEVHSDAHLRTIERVSHSGGGWLDADTYCTAASYSVARLAAGAAVDAVDAVCRGVTEHAVALVRPPGHHATRERAMGFCLFNNAAVATRAAQRRFGLEKVAIVDIDVHHGNGTQDIFYDDASVLYCSLHQWPLYPGTGGVGERGQGAGAGATLNVPLPPGTGGEGWLAAFDDAVAPAVRAFRPGLLVVSAGYDGHRADPLAELRLETDTYAAVAHRLLGLAAETDARGTVWLLEGGYDLDALAESVGVTLTALAGAGTGGGTLKPPT